MRVPAVHSADDQGNAGRMGHLTVCICADGADPGAAVARAVRARTAGTQPVCGRCAGAADMMYDRRLVFGSWFTNSEFLRG